MTDDSDKRLDALLEGAARHEPLPGLAARIAARRALEAERAAPWLRTYDAPAWIDWLRRHPFGGVAWAALPLVLGFALGVLMPAPDPADTEAAWQQLPALAFSDLEAETADDQ